MNPLPNILLITTDQMRFDAAGPHRPEFLRTPHLDVLQRDGVWFDRTYADCPICVPGRMALLTGRHCLDHGMGSNDKTDAYVPSDSGTLPSLMAANGYDTCLVGKAHFHPQRARHGFHHTVTLDSYYRDQARSGGLQPRRHGLGENELVATMATVPEAQTITSWTTETAAEWIRNGRDPRRPWFLWVSYSKPHPPLDPPEPYYSMYLGSPIPHPREDGWSRGSECPPSIRRRQLRNQLARMGTEQILAARAAYYGLVSQIDFGIGRLFAAIQDTGPFFSANDNTLIIATSDHGDHLGDHGLIAKDDPLDGSWRIPLVVRTPKTWPRERRPLGQVSANPACLQDVAATILTAGGGEVPSSWYGQDLLAHPRRREVVGAAGFRQGKFDRIDWTAIADGRWKYIWWFEGGIEQLFDAESDPEERHDLGTSPEHAAIRSRLAEALTRDLSVRQPGLLAGGKLISRPVLPIDEPLARTMAFPGNMWDHHPSDAMH